MRRFLLIVSAMLLAAGFSTGVAQAQPPEDPPCSTPAGEHNPFCPDGPPPSDPPCDTPAGEHNPHCQENGNGGNGNGENGENGCPPAGPVTGVLVTVAEEWEAGGGPTGVSDALVQVACGVHDATGL